MAFSARQRSGIIRRLAKAHEEKNARAGGAVAVIERVLPLTREEIKTLRPMVKAFRARVIVLGKECDELERLLVARKGV